MKAPPLCGNGSRACTAEQILLEKEKQRPSRKVSLPGCRKDEWKALLPLPCYKEYKTIRRALEGCHQSSKARRFSRFMLSPAAHIIFSPAILDTASVRYSFHHLLRLHCLLRDRSHVQLRTRKRSAFDRN